MWRWFDDAAPRDPPQRRVTTGFHSDPVVERGRGSALSDRRRVTSQDGGGSGLSVERGELRLAGSGASWDDDSQSQLSVHPSDELDSRAGDVMGNDYRRPAD